MVCAISSWSSKFDVLRPRPSGKVSYFVKTHTFASVTVKNLSIRAVSQMIYWLSVIVL